MSDSSHPLRLLLAEDSEEDEFLLLRHLRKAGYDPIIHRVQTAETLRDALSKGPWDLIVSDYQMPGFSGMEALAICKEETPDCPFLLVSGTIGEEIAVEAMRAGANDYLLKGNFARLGPAIDRELRDQESRLKRKSAEERQRKLEATIQSILVGTASAIGQDFFRSLVRELARSLGVKIALVGEVASSGGTHIKVIAIHGLLPDQIPEGFDYDISGTAAEHLLNNGWLFANDISNSGFLTYGFAQTYGLTGVIGLRLDSSSGKPLGVLCVFDDQPMSEDALARDILSIFGARAASEFERLRAEEERNNLQEQLWHSQKLEAIGTLAGGISHDINNILSSIWGHAQILDMRKCVPEADQESLQGILAACRRARDLVKQILSFSRKTPPETSIVQLGDIAQETVSLLRATVPANVTIHCIIDSATPPIKADPNQMHQVLMNLCTNAWHAMEANGGDLEINIWPSRENNIPLVRCTISDTGSGIPEQIIGRIFEPFFTTKAPGTGTGLGLSVVHGIIRNHGGTINVRSQVGHGTIFTIELPAIDAFPSSISEGTLSSIPLGNSQKILVVDDETAVSDVLCQLLEILGYAPFSMSDPLEAIEKFRSDPDQWAAVITDRTMPSMNGENLAQALHSIRKEIPIVMSSGYEGDLRDNEISNKEIQALLPKPFQASDLAIVLRRILQG